MVITCHVTDVADVQRGRGGRRGEERRPCHARFVIRWFVEISLGAMRSSDLLGYYVDLETL